MKRKVYYMFPELKSNNDGVIILLEKRYVAPIEVLTYGITSERKFFLEWVYPLTSDIDLGCDYREITKERLINDLTSELNNCDNEEDESLPGKIKKILDFVIQYNNSTQ